MGWRPGVVWVGREKRSGPILGRKREREREREKGFSKLFNFFKNHTTSSKTDAKA
jgi:hypothetical protein